MSNRARRPTTLLAAAALALVAVVGGVLVLQRDGGGASGGQRLDEQSGPSAYASFTADGARVRITEAVDLASPEGAAQSSAGDVVAMDETTLLASGTFVGDVAHGILWQSSDAGRTWEGVDPPEEGRLTGLAARGDGGVLAVGYQSRFDGESSEPAGAWLWSTDGVDMAWEASAIEGMDPSFAPVAVATDGNDVVVVGGRVDAGPLRDDGDGAVVAVSMDGGESWTATAVADGENRPQAVDGVAFGADRFFLRARTTREIGISRYETDVSIWVSEDGDRWDVADDPGDPSGFGDVGGLFSLGDGVAAVGEPGRLAVTRDGREWVEVPVDGIDGGDLGDYGWTGEVPETGALVDDALVFVGADQDGFRPRAWLAAIDPSDG